MNDERDDDDTGYSISWMTDKDHACSLITSLFPDHQDPSLSCYIQNKILCGYIKRAMCRVNDTMRVCSN